MSCHMNESCCLYAVSVLVQLSGDSNVFSNSKTNKYNAGLINGSPLMHPTVADYFLQKIKQQELLYF